MNQHQLQMPYLPIDQLLVIYNVCAILGNWVSHGHAHVEYLMTPNLSALIFSIVFF